MPTAAPMPSPAKNHRKPLLLSSDMIVLLEWKSNRSIGMGEYQTSRAVRGPPSAIRKSTVSGIRGPASGKDRIAISLVSVSGLTVVHGAQESDLAGVVEVVVDGAVEEDIER